MQMEITPRRSLSLNLETTNKYFGISSPIREMWTSQSIKTMDPPIGYRMSHSLSMDDTRVNPALEKKDNPILKTMVGMFGSLSSLVTKIPTLISSINNPLSVTVVANEGIISPEYILKNLTQSGNHESPNTSSLKLFDEMQDSSYQAKSNIADIFADRVGGKLLDVKSWIEGIQDVQESFNSFNESNDLDLAIHESLKLMKSQNNCSEINERFEMSEPIEMNGPSKRIELNELNGPSKRIELNEPNELNGPSKRIELNGPNERIELNGPNERFELNEPKERFELNGPKERFEPNGPNERIEPTERIGPNKHIRYDELVKFDRNSQDIDEVDYNRITEPMVDDLHNHLYDKIQPSMSSSAEVDDIMECDEPLRIANPHKAKRKTNTVARSRGKARGKYQLRKSGVSQSKHRKERTKQNLYSNIQDDLSVWEERDDSSEDMNCLGDRDLGDRDSDAYHIPDYPVFIESFVLGDAKDSRRRKGRDVKLSYRVRYMPEGKDEVLSPITENFRQRLISESSIDSEDSCCIVFEDELDGSTSDCTCDSDDFEFGDSSDEEDEQQRAGQKVRFNLEPAIHTMIQWNYAYRAARRGPWEEMARDRERFRGRINCIGRILEPILTVKHRECIWRERFSVDDLNQLKI